MKILKHNLASSNRRGLSVIEVLTSIVVALIGVFGVLAMIPFSVKQTQSGLDQDAATSMARSALSNFEAKGYRLVSASDQLNWVDSSGSRVVANQNTPLVCIDPLGITGGGVGDFPFNSTSPITLPRVNLLSPDGSQFGVADARRMFRLTDDLVFAQSDDPSNPDSDLLGPQQIFNEGAGGFLNRQSTGAVSWCAIAEPIVNSTTATEVDSFKFYVLVFKDRATSPDPDPLVKEMAAAPVVTPAAGTFAQPLSSVTLAAPLSNDIRRNDWVMLINSSSTPPTGAGTNLAFARVSNLANVGGSSTITLDGPDFNFTGTTTIVHLKNVVAVFPRTIELESASEWTVDN